MTTYCNNFLTEHSQRLILLHYFHRKIFQEKTTISKNPNFFGQTLVFLPLGKPRLHIESNLPIADILYSGHLAISGQIF